jgi:hypothetical protein
LPPKLAEELRALKMRLTSMHETGLIQEDLLAKGFIELTDPETSQ